MHFHNNSKLNSFFLIYPFNVRLHRTKFIHLEADTIDNHFRRFAKQSIINKFLRVSVMPKDQH